MSLQTVAMSIGCASLLTLAACRPQAPGAPDGILDDSAETDTLMVEVPFARSPIQVLVGERDAFICERTRHTVGELLREKAGAHAYKDGYVFVDVAQPNYQYRAYFRPEHLGPAASTYVFCSGTGAAVSGIGCVLVGTTADRCFESYISRAETIEAYDVAGRAVQGAMVRSGAE